MHRLPVRPVVAALIGLTVSRAHAQSRFELSPFASRNSSLEGSPTLLGAALTSYSGRLGGIFGLRFGGGYDIRSLTSSNTAADAVGTGSLRCDEPTPTGIGSDGMPRGVVLPPKPIENPIRYSHPVRVVGTSALALPSFGEPVQLIGVRCRASVSNAIDPSVRATPIP